MKHILLTLLLALAACAPAAADIQPVTALPTDFATDTLEPSPTIGATLTPTSAVAALFANAPTSVAATPMPRDNDLEAGTAREIALATDAALRWTPAAPVTFEDGATVPITFDEFYDGYNLRTGLILSDKLLSLDGLEVSMEGYMAPPLKAELDYFVLTRIRLAFCPFCTNASDWPDDIALVYMEPGNAAEVTLSPIRIVGQMEVGTSVDEETGMVSLVRIYAHTLEIID
jgi:hypothetical protein